jgi:hypothetical protein
MSFSLLEEMKTFLSKVLHYCLSRASFQHQPDIQSLLLITAHYFFDNSTPYRHRSFASLSALHLLTAGVRHTLEVITNVHGQYPVDLDRDGGAFTHPGGHEQVFAL